MSWDCTECLVDPCECHCPERRRAAGWVEIKLSNDEKLACFDWIREGNSKETIDRVCAVLKRLIGEG